MVSMATNSQNHLANVDLKDEPTVIPEALPEQM
jgi:hypothetical protein